MREFIRYILTKRRSEVIFDPSAEHRSLLLASSPILWVNSTTQGQRSLVIALFALRKYGRTDLRTQPEGKIASRL